MRTKKGFTLAEVLITLSIIGVAAALTVPMLANNIQKALAGPKLARVINQMEAGSQEYLAYRAKKDGLAKYEKFSEISGGVAVADLAPFWGLAAADENTMDIDKYKGYASLPAGVILPSAYAATLDNSVEVLGKTQIGDGNTIPEHVDHNADVTNPGSTNDSEYWKGPALPGGDNPALPGANGEQIPNPDVGGEEPSVPPGVEPIVPPPNDPGGGEEPSDPDDEETDDEETDGGTGTSCNTYLCQCLNLRRNLLKYRERGGVRYNLDKERYEKLRCHDYIKDYCSSLRKGTSWYLYNRYNELGCQEFETNPENPDNPANPENPDIPAADSTSKSYYAKKGGHDINFLGTELNSPDSKGKVLEFYVDINGYKSKPNMKGKDLFKFSLTDSGKLVPEGLDTYKTDCANGNVSDGLSCTARIVRDGFKIKY